MANPHPFATMNHICLALGIPRVSRAYEDLVSAVQFIQDYIRL